MPFKFSHYIKNTNGNNNKIGLIENIIFTILYR